MFTVPGVFPPAGIPHLALEIDMITWSTDKLKKEIEKGHKRKWLHLPALEAELARRDVAHAASATPMEKTMTAKLPSA